VTAPDAVTPRRVIVTGGMSGIGAATVERFRSAGDRVVVLDRKPGSPDRSGESIRVDLAAWDQAVGGVTEAAERLGGLDVLVCAAGVGAGGTLDDTTRDAWDLVFSVNARAVFACSQAALPYMRQGGGGGVIVIVASQIGLVAQERSIAYCASKAAAIQLARAISLDHAVDGVRAVAVCPGATDTPMLTETVAAAPDPDAAASALRARSLHGRFIQAAEIAEAIWYVASPQAGSVYGMGLVIDAGYTAV
jgi:NAD(P)-dependent dehydrogenase (short-subunit alcohol dehydrogenase family)